MALYSKMGGIFTVRSHLGFSDCGSCRIVAGIAACEKDPWLHRGPEAASRLR